MLVLAFCHYVNMAYVISMLSLSFYSRLHREQLTSSEAIMWKLMVKFAENK